MSWFSLNKPPVSAPAVDEELTQPLETWADETATQPVVPPSEEPTQLMQQADVFDEGVAELPAQDSEQERNMATWQERLEQVRDTLAAHPVDSPALPMPPSPDPLDEVSAYAELDRAVREGDGRALRQLVAEEATVQVTEDEPTRSGNFVHPGSVGVTGAATGPEDPSRPRNAHAPPVEDPMYVQSREGEFPVRTEARIPTHDEWVTDNIYGMTARLDRLTEQLGMLQRDSLIEEHHNRIGALERDYKTRAELSKPAGPNGWTATREEFNEAFESLHEVLMHLPQNPMRGIAVQAFSQARIYVDSCLNFDLMADDIERRR